MRRIAVVQDVALPDGRALQARVWPGHGGALVLLHGLFDDSEGWLALARGTRRPCIALDLPGFGGSGLPVAARLGAYADDVAAGLDELGLHACTLVGHSLGGAVAAHVAERSPAVRSLCLLSPAGFGRIPLADLVARRGVIDLAQLALPLGLVNPLTVTAAYATFVAHGRLPTRELLGRLRRRAFHAAPGVRAAVEALAASGRDRDGLAHRPLAFAGPVAALWGARDVLVPPAHAERVTAAAPGAHVEIWEGMGHHPQRERPRSLARFVEEHAARPVGASDTAAA